MDQDGQMPDLYRLLGVSPEASQGEIALAWRRRARDEHPDARPADADAPGRFRALAQAWQVLGDPARRATYDRALAGGQSAAAAGGRVQVPVRHVRRRGQGQRPAPELPLRAGPVWIEPAGTAAQADRGIRNELRLVILAELAWRYLDQSW